MLLGLVVLFFWPVLTSPGVVVHGADFIAAYPERAFAMNALWKGDIPLWNPYAFSGYPFLPVTHLVRHLFYLPGLVFAFLPLNLALSYDVAFHIFLAGLFTLLALRDQGVNWAGALISAVGFMFSNYFLGQVYAGHLAQLGSAVWLPLAFLLLRRMLLRRKAIYGAWLGLVLTFCYLAGHQHIFAYTVFALGLYFLYWAWPWWHEVRLWVRWGLSLAGALLVPLALGAFQTLPLLELLPRLTRAEVGVEFGSEGAMPFYNIITFLVPDFLGNPMTQTSIRGAGYWGMGAYAGVLTLVLALLALIYTNQERDVRFFAGLAVLSIVLALGDNTPLFRLVTLIPGANILGNPGRALYLYTFSLIMLAGWGGHWLSEGRMKDEEGWTKWLTVALPVLAGIGVLPALGFYLARSAILALGERLIRDVYSPERGAPPEFYLSKLEMLYGVQLQGLMVLALLLVGCCILVLLYLRGGVKPRILKVGLVFLIVLDLYLFGGKFVQAVDPAAYAAPDYGELLTHLDEVEDFDLYRVIPPSEQWNRGMIYEVSEPTGYDPLILNRYANFIALIEGKDKSAFDPRSVYITNLASPLVDLLNVRYAFLEEKIDVLGWNLVGGEGPYIYRNHECLPRAFVVGEARVLPNGEAVLAELGNADFDPRRCILLEEGKEAVLAETSKVERAVVEVIHYSPDRIVVVADLPAPGYLLLSEVFYPGWKAYVDGVEEHILRADYILRAVYLDKGTHTVTFVFAPTSLKVGIGISLLTALGLVGFIGLRMCEKRAESTL